MAEENKKNKKDEVLKSFGLTTAAIKNKTTVFFLSFLVVVMGLLSYQNLPKENFPEVSLPTVYIGTPFPGNSPADIENLVTRPIEKEINSISDVKDIRSTSVQDYSTIIVEFNSDVDVQEALIDVKDAVDKAKPELPGDLPQDPNVFELNFSEFPILKVNLTGNLSQEELKEHAENLKDEIENISEISEAELVGIDEKEMKILADPYKMAARRVTFTDIENAVKAENLTMSGGSLKQNEIRRTVRIVGEFERARQIEDIIVKSEQGNIVYLKDVADVQFEYADKSSYARLESDAVVALDIKKRSGENLIIATEKVMEVLDEYKEGESYPAELELTLTNDQSKMTKDMVSNLENNIISGVILVTLTLLFFLGTRNSLFVGMAIPISMFMAFAILGALGITINMMVLFALIMALGMLVDNGIVVVENVYRLMEQGYGPWEATKYGVGEVAMPIISSTATTLAAFLPLMFWPGIMGEFMYYLPTTLIIVLGSSLFVALVINPVFIGSFMKLQEKTFNRKRMLIRSLIAVGIAAALITTGLLIDKYNVTIALGNLIILVVVLLWLNILLLNPLSVKFQMNFLPKVEAFYERSLRFALRGHNYIFFFVGTIITLILSVGLFAWKMPKVEFFPENIPKYVNVFIEFPIGTDVEKTNEFTQKVNQRLDSLIQPYRPIIESVVTNVGQGTADPGDPTAVSMSETPNQARITVNFVDFKYRDGIDTREALNDIREGMKGIAPGVTITVAKDRNGPPVGKPISIEISGEEYDRLIEVTENVLTKINNSDIEGIEKLKSDLETGKPELIIDIDRDKARRFGVSTYSIGNELRTSIFGKEIGQYKLGEDDYDIELRLAEKYRYDMNKLMNRDIIFRDQSSGSIHQVPISSVADAELSTTYGSIKRRNLDRVVSITSNVIQGYNATEITQQLKDLLAGYNLPQGYEIKFTGEQEQQAEELEFLSSALILAVFLIFLIIVAQFNKITAPLIIMTSVILSTIGVFLGLVVFNMKFVVIMTMIGIISLAGIVVNNAIVLIDFIELIRERKRAELHSDARLSMHDILESIVEAGKTRLRPVLLTAITTVLGLIPLAVGINIDFIKFFTEYQPDFYIGGDNVIFWGPMSWTIIFGLSFATFLTLVIVPVMYLIFDKINHKFHLSKY
ncbi:efflux RND transporter permease subunit [Mangrovivirga cuniculi]|uniref:Copper transporter n=1 Tax=Mangrovivirga cuniculi TaxID=2715131 RepID=A0A4D7JKD5_9BACT|nr:efflux RND transporter permease subunit [Mangrovivirga cuniculi]QCK16061.1 copper transporter [Mangrovivirga cuniculi]